MKVLYAIKLTELTQLLQAQLLVRCFTNHNVDVDIMLSDGSFSWMKGSKRLISELKLSGAKQLLRSVSPSFSQLSYKQQACRLLKRYRGFKSSNYDVVISDNEQVAAWAAKFAGISVLALGHQVAVNQRHSLLGEGVLSKTWQNLCMPADYHLGFHWQPFAKNILPPLVANYSGPCIANKVVIYLPEESLPEISLLLESFPNTEFYCFHPDAKDSSRGHIHFRNFQHEALMADLLSCRGIICHAQFDLLNVALKLGKQILLKPHVHEQTQLEDANILEQLGWAQQMHYLNANAVEDFLDIAPGEAIAFSADPYPLVKWIMAADWYGVEQLHSALWQQVKAVN